MVRTAAGGGSGESYALLGNGVPARNVCEAWRIAPSCFEGESVASTSGGSGSPFGPVSKQSVRNFACPDHGPVTTNSARPAGGTMIDFTCSVGGFPGYVSSAYPSSATSCSVPPSSARFNVRCPVALTSRKNCCSPGAIAIDGCTAPLRDVV